MTAPKHPTIERSIQLLRLLRMILGPEKRYYVLTLIYGIGISLLTLSTPISVQMLVNSVAQTGLAAPLVVLSLTLFVLLLAFALLSALRIHLMDLFARRFYSRMVAEIALRAIYAVNPFFGDASRGQLFNRYFDIIIVVKTMPYLLIGGFTIVLQSGFGFVLVSLYHPYFFVFIAVLILLAWLIWQIWGRAAIMSGIELSHRKHATAAWLQGLAASNGFFKSEGHIDDALARTELATANYIDQHRRHFRNHFSQTVGFLVLYAAASAALLGLGGWLVIQGQLTLGQLVAAELVLSVAFFGMSQMGLYLTYFYDLSAAVEELSLFEEVEQESLGDGRRALPVDGAVRFSGVTGRERGVPCRFDFALPAGASVHVRAEALPAQRVFTGILKGRDPVTAGLVTIGGVDLEEIELQMLRRSVIVLDRPQTIEMSLREFLRLSGADHHGQDVLEALRTVGLEATVAELEEGLDTRVSATGWPLSVTEAVQLKLASAILAEPRVVVLSQIYDLVDEDRLRAATEVLQRTSNTTVVRISNHPPRSDYDLYLNLGATVQTLSESPLSEIPPPGTSPSGTGVSRADA